MPWSDSQRFNQMWKFRTDDLQQFQDRRWIGRRQNGQCFSCHRAGRHSQVFQPNIGTRENPLRQCTLPPNRLRQGFIHQPRHGAIRRTAGQLPFNRLTSDHQHLSSVDSWYTGPLREGKEPLILADPFQGRPDHRQMLGLPGGPAGLHIMDRLFRIQQTLSALFLALNPLAKILEPKHRDCLRKFFVRSERAEPVLPSKLGVPL